MYLYFLYVLYYYSLFGIYNSRCTYINIYYLCTIDILIIMFKNWFKNIISFFSTVNSTMCLNKKENLNRKIQY